MLQDQRSRPRLAVYAEPPRLFIRSFRIASFRKNGRSVFEDDVWYLPTPGGRATLNWTRIEFRDGSNITSPIHSDLLRASKMLLTLLAIGKAARGRSPRGNTFSGYFESLRLLLIWMSGRKVFAFRDLTLPHIIGYRNAVQNHVPRSSRTQRHNKADGTRTATATQMGKLRIILHLVELQAQMGSLGTAVDEYEVRDLLSAVVPKSEEPTKRIPDAIFRRLIDAAIIMVDEAGPGISAFESKYQEWLHDRKSRMNRSGKAVMNNDFNIYRRTLSPCVVRFNGAQIDLAALTRHQMTEVLGILRGACFAIVAGLAGMRISELRSLKRGCLIRSELRDGRVLLKISGTLFKTSASAQGEPAEWVAGWDEPGNPIRSAIETLSALSPQHEEPYLFGAKANALRVVGNDHLKRVPQSIC